MLKIRPLREGDGRFKLTNINIQIALALSAASALIYEVVATHMLFFYSDNSSYSIATILSVFLLGLAVGSLIIHYTLHKIKNKVALFCIIQIIIALYAFFVLTNLLDILQVIYKWGAFATSFIILLVPTIFLGAVFPLAGSIFKKEKKEIIGLIYTSDLVGAIIGSLVAGFVLIPNLGSRTTVVFGAGLNLISCLIMFSKKQKIIPVCLIVLLFVTTINIPSLATDKQFLTYKEEDYVKEGYQFYAPSPYGLVTVKNGFLLIDGRLQCCTRYDDEGVDKRLAYTALEPIKQNSRLFVLNIGLGCGLSLEKCLEYNSTVDVVEINEQVVNANKVMSDVLQDPNINLVIDDGLNFLRSNNKKYDSIIMDTELPHVAHSSYLYTVDAFLIVSKSLKQNGTYTLRNFKASDRFQDILYYSLKEVFSFVYSYDGIFLASNQDLGQLEYVPVTSYEINTIDRNTLTDAYLNR